MVQQFQANFVNMIKFELTVKVVVKKGVHKSWYQYLDFVSQLPLV